MPHKQWHPLFVTSLREVLSDALPGQVEIIPELALSSKPLDIDVLVVKKSQLAQLRHPMTDIFRTYNLIEYKSPDDNLDYNDYDRGIAIARLYRVIKHPQMPTLNDITITFVSSKHPVAMLKLLKARELVVHKANPVPGIYRVLGEAIPVQIMVLKELKDPETAYMFAVFLTGKEKIGLAATRTLIKKHLSGPTSPYRRDLLEFKIKNKLISTEEMEVLLKMLSQANENERVKIRELLKSHPFSQEVKLEGITIGEAKGRATAQEAICKFLDVRFGDASQSLQRNVRQINKLEILDNIINKIYTADSLADAGTIIDVAMLSN